MRNGFDGQIIGFFPVIAPKRINVNDDDEAQRNGRDDEREFDSVDGHKFSKSRSD